MNVHESPSRQWNPGWFVYLLLALVLLATWIPLVPDWKTFIHMWRADLAAALVLLGLLGYIALKANTIALPFKLSVLEFRLIVLPLAFFVAWSSLSIFWANSWKSAIHHSTVWLSYLLFYLVFRTILDSGAQLGKLLTLFAGVLLLFAIPAVIEFVPLAAFGSTGGDLWLRVRYAKNGEQVVTLLPLILVFVLRSSGRAFWAGVASVAVLWLLIYCTASRVNLIVFAGLLAAMSLAVVLFARHRRYARKLAICVLAMIAGPVCLYLISAGLGAAEIPVAERLNESSANASSSDFRLLMNSVSMEMVGENPLLGVGADNYGLEFNKYREQYSRSNPSDTRLTYGDAGIVGQAHNEFLQILAELGIVGASIFAWFLGGVAFMGFRALRSLRKKPLIGLAAVLGLGAFLASSLVSSYSFRLVQNGFLFFFVLAVASKSLLRRKPGENTAHAVAPTALQLRFACAIGIVGCLGLAGYTLIRVSSVAITGRANDVRRLDDARSLYQTAMRLDDENPDVRQNLGMRLFLRKRYAEAVPFLRSAIDIGRATATDYSYLATAQTLSGDNIGAEATMAEAAMLYPRSTFILVRYSELLAANGKRNESGVAYERARLVDERAANTWRAVITEGPKSVSELAARDKSYLQVMQLTPTDAIYAAVTERYLKHPDEQRFSMLKVAIVED